MTYLFPLSLAFSFDLKIYNKFFEVTTHSVVSAPTSSIYPDVRSDDVQVSARDCREVTHVQGIQIAPFLESDQIKNYGQDVTPHENITGIITEIGIIRGPCKERIQKIIFSR